MRRALLFILGLLVLALWVLINFLTQEPKTKWQPSFSKSDDVPYGSELVYQYLPVLFPKQEINLARKKPEFALSPYLAVEEHKELNEVQNAELDSADTTLPTQITPPAAQPDTLYNYILINTNFYFDANDCYALSRFLQQGNTVFIAAHQVSGLCYDDSLLRPLLTQTANWSFRDTNALYFNSHEPALKGRWRFGRRDAGFTFTNIDTLNTKVEVLASDTTSNPVLIRAQIGKGTLIYASTPYIFTNFNLLKDNNVGYIARVLSFLPVQTVIWDEYYKYGMAHAKEEDPIEDLIASSEALQWARMLLIAAALLMVLTMAKRRLRPIPVVRPPKNATLEFVQTMGRLYFKQKNHTGITHKRIEVFLEHLRSRYHIRTDATLAEKQTQLAERARIPLVEAKALLVATQQLQASNMVDEASLLAYSSQLEAFYQKAY